MSAKANKALVRKWFEEVDTGDVGVIDKYVSPKYHDHNPPPFPGAGPDIEGGRKAFEYALSAFSNFHHEIAEQLAEGDLVATRVTGFGTHTGEFMGVPPTGQDVHTEGIVIHRIEDGKLVEHWSTVDAVNLLIQLGAIPPLPA